MPRQPLPIPELAPSARYRYGLRDGDAVTAHTDQSRAWRRALADEWWTDRTRAHVLTMLAAEPDPAAVMRRLGRGASALYGRMAYDERLRADVERVLADACAARGDHRCGTPIGYKVGGRCRSCRDAHRGRRVTDRDDSPESGH